MGARGAPHLARGEGRLLLPHRDSGDFAICAPWWCSPFIYLFSKQDFKVTFICAQNVSRLRLGDDLLETQEATLSYTLLLVGSIHVGLG